MGTITITTIIYSIVIAIIIAAVLFVAMRFVHKLYPVDPIETGREIDIYQNGYHNRTATITRLTPNQVVIYDVLPLPIHYRGKFYSVGYTSDGSTLMYIGKKKLFRLARMAEMVRKVVSTPEYPDYLPGENSTEETTESVEEVENEM